MQGSGWITLFQRIPPEHHDSLVLMTTTGTELVLQRVVQLERDFMVVLGRLGGSTEQGKVLVIPYDQLSFVTVSKKMDDAEIQALLSNQDAKLGDSRPLPIQVREKPVQPQPPLADAKEPLPAPAIAAKLDSGKAPGENGNDKVPPHTTPKAPPSKSILLARLRERLANDQSRPIKP